MNKCSELAQVWADMSGEKSLKCLNKSSRSAGNIPECTFYARNLESLKKESIVAGK